MPTVFCRPSVPYSCRPLPSATISAGTLSNILQSLTFKKFPLRSRLWLWLKLCGYLFSQLLNEKVDFLWLLGKNSDLIHFLILFNMNYDLIYYLSLTWSRSRELKLQYNSSSSGRKFRLLADPAPALQHWLHVHVHLHVPRYMHKHTCTKYLNMYRYCSVLFCTVQFRPRREQELPSLLPHQCIKLVMSA